MATRPTNSQAQLLEQYRVALENATNQPEIAAALAELGYNSTKIDEGKALLATTREFFQQNQKEDDETTVAYANFSNKKTELEKIYASHRKKAKVIFRKDLITSEKLAITGTLAKAYIKWLETIKKFYTLTAADTTIQTQLAKLKITTQDITDANDKISQLENARAEYLKEEGESQDATKAKDNAFATMDDWMSEFYAVAKIALEDKPQLLEALGKTIKS